MTGKAQVMFAILIAGVGAGDLLLPKAAAASDYGCQVLLCLANPGGPTQYAECVPPISRLWDDLFHGRAFPTCDMAGNSSYAQMLNTDYDFCKDGLTSLPAHVKAITRETYNGLGTYTGYSEWDPPPPVPVFSGSGENGQICVGNAITTTTVTRRLGTRSTQRINVTVYDRIVVQPKQGENGRAIDVYIDNQIHNRVFW